MNLTSFLQELRRVGVTLECDAGALKVHGPKGALTLELRSALASHKQALLAWLDAASADGGTGLPLCEPDVSALYEPFPLADLQLGFYMSDDPYFEFHVRPHYYSERNLVDFQVNRYEAAWNKMLRRHHREIITVRSEGDLVTVKDPAPLRAQVYDLRDRSIEEVERALSEVRQQMMRSELPLDRWPWVDLRVSIWRDGPVERARVHYNHNNFFSDGYGTARMFQEIDRYYQQPDLALPELSLSFRDATIALDRLAHSGQGIAARRYWEDRLPNLPGPPELPTRAGMNRRCRSRLNRREMFINAAQWRGFKENARSSGLTPSSAIFAVYAELLAAWSNSSHFVLSNMMTRRLNIHQEIREILGNFASLYPLEIDLRGDDTFAERARRVQEQVIRDFQHRAWGGMQVMQALNRQEGGFGRAAIPFVIGSGLFMEGFARSDFSCLETSQVMLDHQFWEMADGSCYYVWDLLEEFFPPGMIDDMCEAYKCLVARLAEDVGCWQVKRLDVTPALHLAERSAMHSPSRPVTDLRLGDFLDIGAAAYPDELVLVTPGATLTYRQLAENSNRLAGALRQAGVARGQIVAVVADRGPAMFAAVHAVLRLGAAYVPIDPLLPDERRAYMLENSGAAHVIAEESYARRLNWPAGVAVLTPDMGEAHVGAWDTERGWITDLAYVIYTSGSTGRPKGVMIDNRGAVNTILDVNQRFGIGRGDRIFGVSSFGFDLSVYDIFGTVAAGATVVYPNPAHALNPAHWIDLLAGQQVTIWNSAPPLAVLLTEAAEFRGAQLPELKLVMLSGDWIPVDLPARIRKIAPNARIVSLGGATEASIWSILYEIGEVDPSWSSIPYGYPMLNQSWFVLDHWGRPAPEWTPGELYIGGIGLALGYVRNHEETAKHFLAHPTTGERIYRTGDLGRYLPGGVIEFLGRKDSQVKLQGHRIELGEIQTVLAGCPGVGAALVVIQKSETGGSAQLAAYVVSESSSTIDGDELQELLRRKLPDYMVPRLIKVLDRLPLSPNGKVDHSALPRLDTRASGAVSRPAREPLDVVEVRLIELWQHVLKHDGITVYDDFFELGGRSFEAVRLVGRIFEVFGVSLSAGDIWQDRTVAELAKRLRSGDKVSPQRCLVRIKGDGVGAPLFLVHPAGGHVLCYSEIASRLGRPVFAFQAPGVDGNSAPPESIPEFAKRYIECLNEVQPSGPALLGGWSSGGLVAYEMAVQMRAQGRPVEGIILIDSPAPLVHEQVSDQVLFDWFVGDLNLGPRVQAALDGLERGGFSEERLLEQVVLLMRQQGIDLGTSAKPLASIYRVFKTIVRASRAYHAVGIEADMLVVRARQGVVNEFAHHPFADSAGWGWDQLTQGQVQGSFVEGTHYTLLSLPAVEFVAAAVESWVSREKTMSSSAEPSC